MLRFKRASVFAISITIFVLCGAKGAVAQGPTLRLPRPSQKASVMQTIGVTDVTITYSRPGVKGRKIWGDAWKGAENANSTATLDDQNERPKDAVIVPYGHVWRSGANEATTFAVTDDVLINGQKLAAGTYSLHTIPGKTEWTIILNSDAGQWGSFFYDEKKDALRVLAKPQFVADNQEWLMYSMPNVTANSAQVVIRWEKLALPFTVEVPNVEAVTRAHIDAAIAADPSDWKIPLAVGNQLANDDNWNDALMWAERSIKVKETFQNLSAKARWLAAAGRKDEALAVAELAIQRGKSDKVDMTRFEKWLAGFKAGKM